MFFGNVKLSLSVWRFVQDSRVLKVYPAVNQIKVNSVRWTLEAFETLVVGGYGPNIHAFRIGILSTNHVNIMNPK